MYILIIWYSQNTVRIFSNYFGEMLFCEGGDKFACIFISGFHFVPKLARIQLFF